MEMPVLAESVENDVRPIKVTARLIVAVLTVNLLGVGYGSRSGYASPALPDINRNPNPLRLGSHQQSWVVSLFSLGSAIGAIVCGTTTDYLGRKLAMMSSSLLCVAALTVITAADCAIHLYVGFFLGGFTSNVNFSACMLYVSETSPTNIRGALTMTNTASYALGLFVVYVAGTFMPWNWLAIFVAAFYALPVPVLAFLPESPRWLLLKGRRDEAVESFAWFRSTADDVKEEVRVIEESLVASSISSSWTVLLEPNNLTTLATCCAAFFVQAFSGVIVLQVNSVTIFDAAGLNWSPNVQSIVTGVFFFIGSIACPLVVERLGRKSLLVASTSVVGICMATTGIFFSVEKLCPDYAHEHLFWLPCAALSLGTFSFATGLQPVPYLLACELFPTRVRANAQTVITFVMGLMYFACLKSFINIQEAIGTSGAFFVYAAVCAVGTLFMLFVIKEPSREAMR